MIPIRRGSTLIEVSVATVILAVVAVVCAQFLTAMARRGHGLRDREIAVQEAANVMERLHAVSWDELTPELAARIGLSAEVTRAMPDVALKVEITPSPNRADARQLAVRLIWDERADRLQPPVRLVAWRYEESRSSGVQKEAEK